MLRIVTLFILKEKEMSDVVPIGQIPENGKWKMETETWRPKIEPDSGIGQAGDMHNMSAHIPSVVVGLNSRPGNGTVMMPTIINDESMSASGSPPDSGTSYSSNSSKNSTQENVVQCHKLVKKLDPFIRLCYCVVFSLFF